MPTDIIITPGSGEIAFHNTQGTVCGKISTSGNNLVFANEAGDVLIGDGSSDIYVGDGINNVDIVFEQDGEIRGEVGSAVTLTLGSNDTTVYVTGSTLAFQKDGGNVGIGTNSPSATLTVNGSTHISSSNAIGTILGTTGGNLVLNNTTGEWQFKANGSSVTSATINASLITLNEDVYATGDVGIGTTSPGEKLHVYQGNIEIEAAAASAQGLIFSENGTQTMGIKYQGGQSGNPIDIFRYQDNTTKVRFTEAGYVGIGTTSPGYKLDVDGDINLQLGDNIRFGSQLAIKKESNGELQLYGGTNSSDGGFVFNTWNGSAYEASATINNSKRLGVGTTSPNNELEILGSNSPRISLRTSNEAVSEALELGFQVGTGANASSNSVGIIKSVITQATPSALIGDMEFQTNSGDAISTKMIIKGDGNVGINMNSPISSLHIGDGNDTISSALYSTDILNVSAQNTAPGFNIISAGSSAYNRGVFKATRSRGTLASPTATGLNDYVFSLLGVAYDGTAGRATAGVEMRVDGNVSSGNAPQRIEFQTGTTTSRSTRMTIKSSGNVGIGTTSPGTKLDVNGDITADNLYLASNIIHEGDTNTSFQFSTDTIRLNTAGNARLTLGSTGTVTLGAYGSGTKTGTSAYTLAVDASGNIIEIATAEQEERGTFSVSTDGVGAGSFSHSLGETPTIVLMTCDSIGGNVTTICVTGKSSTTISVKSSQRNATVTGYYIIS